MTMLLNWRPDKHLPQVKKEVRDIEKTFVITGWVERWGRKGFGVGVSRYKLFLYRVDKHAYVFGNFTSCRSHVPCGTHFPSGV